MTKLFIIFIILGLSLSAQASDWVHFSSDDYNNDFYYDKQSIFSKEKDIIEVLGKTTFSDKGRLNYINNQIKNNRSTQGLEKFSYVLLLWSFNCPQKEYGLSSSPALYSSEGIAISEVSKPYSTIKWSPVLPDSISELIYKIVCTQDNK
jgi:hypothetical protein